MKKVLVGLLIILGLVVSNYLAPRSKKVGATVEQKVVELHIVEPTSKEDEKLNSFQTVRIVPFGKAICSGEFIDKDGDILTAKHCTSTAQSIEVVTYDQKKYDAVILAQSNIHDLAIIHIDRTNTPYFSFAKSVVRGQLIYALGSPLGITDVLSKGIIAAIKGDDILVDCSVLPGNSGGPLFDSDQNLVGVVVAGYVVGFGVTHLNVVQSLEAVQPFVDAVLDHYERKR